MKKKVLFASCIGNALEFFDFMLYGAFISLIAKAFFPNANTAISILMSISAFGVGLTMRPFGALIFGYFGDVFGRKNALSISILMMGIPTFVIGILPTYEQIGIISSLIIIIGRLLQGICVGGEYNGAAIFAIEHFHKNPGLVGGCVTSSCAVGAILATALGMLVQLPGTPEWAWRIPFLLGGVVSLVGYYIRRNLTESPVFLNTFSKPSIPIIKSILSRKRSCLVSFSFGALNGAITYTLFGFLNIYLSRYFHMPLSTALKINLFGLSGFMIGSPLLGALYDKMPNFSFMQGISFTLFCVMLPIFWLISSETQSLIIVGQIALGFCTASIAGTGHVVMQKLFPVKERYSGISFFFSLGLGIFGCMTPIIMIEAIEFHHDNLYFPAFFLMFLVILFYAVLKYSNVFKTPKKQHPLGRTQNLHSRKQ